MKRTHYLMLATSVLAYPTFVASDCQKCREYQAELKEAWKHNLDMAKELRTLVKDFSAQGAQLRKSYLG